MIISGFIEAEQELIPSSELEPLCGLEGTTCLLYRLRSGGRRLLLKQLKPELAGNPRMIEAFQKEFAIGQSLHHPNLVQYKEIHESADGIYLLMEYVDGDTLSQRMLRNPEYFAHPDHLLKFFTQLLSCLQHLHLHQVLHLDIKPDNILLTRVSDDVKLIDLGFCYTDSYDQTMGRNDLYSAPEQKPEAKQQVDVRSDLYAVGRLLQDILLLICHELPGSLRSRLEKIAQHSTQQDKSLRYASAEEMSAALQEALNQKSSLHRTLIISIAVTVVLAILLAVIHFISAPKTSIPLSHIYLHGYGYHYQVLSEDSLTCEVTGFELPVGAENADHYVITSPVDYDHRSYQVIAVRDSAFLHDSLVTTLALPEGVKTIGSMACFDCPNLYAVSLPSTLQSIAHDAFASCPNLHSIVLPPSLKRIDRCAFVGTYSLRNIVIPEGITFLPVDCFVSSGLQHITLPSSLRAIERGVFYDCRSLRSITLPANLQTIGDYCFHHCDSLLEVRCLNPVPPVITNIFADTIGLHRILYVPAESVESYQLAPYWSEFAEIKALP